MKDLKKAQGLVPLRCTPEADESLTGYILRLALRNHQSSPGPLAVAAGIRQLPILFPSPEQITKLAAISGISPDFLANMAAERIPVATARKRSCLRGIAFPRDWLTARRRACPQCLEESPHRRIAWDIVHIRACGTHSCALLASCPDCGRHLRWSDADLRRCYCGVDVSRRKSPPYDTKAARWIAGTFAGDGSPPPRLLEGVRFVPAVTALTLLEAAFLGCLARDLIAPSILRGDESQAFAYQALDGDLDRLRHAIEHAEDKPDGRAFRMARVAITELSRLSAATSGMEAVGAMIEDHLRIPVPIR